MGVHGGHWMGVHGGHWMSVHGGHWMGVHGDVTRKAWICAIPGLSCANPGSMACLRNLEIALIYIFNPINSRRPIS